jgi:hypothetical protein
MVVLSLLVVLKCVDDDDPMENEVEGIPKLCKAVISLAP